MWRHKSVIKYTRVSTCLYVQKLSCKNKHFICIRIYGATILNWQLSKITASTPLIPSNVSVSPVHWKLLSMTSFTEHLWWKLAETLKVKSRSARHPRAKPSVIHDNASILRTRVVQSLKYYRCCHHYCGFFYYTRRQIKSVFSLVISWISTSWAGWLVLTSMKRRLLGLYKFPVTIKRYFCEASSFYCFVNVCARLQKKNLQTRHDNISCSYHTMLFVQASINSMYCIYSIHSNVRITLYYIFLVRRTTNISNSKQVSSRHLNSLRWPCAVYVICKIPWFGCDIACILVQIYEKQSLQLQQSFLWIRFKCISYVTRRRRF